MTGSPDNFSLPPLPPGLDEVDLLAWVEGDPLPRNREVAVARLLSANPALAGMLDGLRRDKEVLASLGADERAPAGLLDGVRAAIQPVMERQMLLGLQDGPLVDEHPPVSLVALPHRSLVDVLLRERAGRKMALAAGLLLLVGGTTYFAAVMFSGGGPQASEVGRVARQPDPSGDSAIVMRAPVEADPVENAAGAATDPARDDPAAGATLAQGPIGQEDEGMGAGATALALQNDGTGEAGGEVERAPMTVAEALRLAEANRLVIRVRLGEGLVRSEPVVDRLRRNSSGWRYAGEAPALIASALIGPAPAGGPMLVRPGEVVAGVDLRGTPRDAWYGPPSPRAFMEPPPSRTTVHLVQSRLDSSSLESLRTALAGVSGEVWFEEADAGIEPSLESAPNLAPSAVLWWSQPPAAWTWWSSVPVVIEPGR
jgi:hypothetical protein